jgi:hypothetical protein
LIKTGKSRLFGLGSGDLVKWNKLSPKNSSGTRDDDVGLIVSPPSDHGSLDILIEGEVVTVNWNEIIPLRSGSLLNRSDRHPSGV